MGHVLSGGFAGLLALIVLLIGVLVGSYPAFFLSRFAPQLLLKEGVAGAGKQRVRKVLMAAQFAIALFMVVGTLAVFAQLQWLRTNDMGLRKENVLLVKMPSPHPEDTLKWDALRPMKTELMRESFVTAASFADNTPGVMPCGPAPTRARKTRSRMDCESAPRAAMASASSMILCCQK